MDRRYEYYAIVTLAYPHVADPALVCRRWTDENGRVWEEAFTHQLAWVPSTELSRVEAGQWDAGVHPTTAEDALRFETIQRDRIVDQGPVDGKYIYYAWVDYDSSVDDPNVVIRTWTTRKGHQREEMYTHDLGWRHSDLHDDISRGREAGDLVRITEEAAERFKEIVAERRQASQG